MATDKISKLSKNCKVFTGQRFGRLVVMGITNQRSKTGCVIWRCICDCGNECFKSGSSLRLGFTRSCGCLLEEHIRQLIKTNTIHGMTGTPIHNTWNDMLCRCGNPKNKGYKNYGGRGIQVCEEWKNSFVSFVNYVKNFLGSKPTSAHSIDRINNDWDYEPGNIRWATKEEQSNNRRPISCGPSKQRWFRAWHKDSMCQFTSNNQGEFARRHGLSRDCVHGCLNGKQKIHKGWCFVRCV